MSFGYGHAPAPEADLTIDARRLFRNRCDDPAMRHATGLDADVRDHVMATPGIGSTIAAAIHYAIGLASCGLDCTIAAGCAGGRRRSVVLAAEIARGLRDCGVAVQLTHRDVHSPVIQA
ncbi:RapZ C-terminal domain-containing protein [Sphaerisporangium siamense]|uniref:UPF0042 nucleotide-binding protein n=1 Tax=Sphaerisporangium siamense TaxID=795645 RepID=A0A7W7GB03_9ACTN|nr:RNase adapter RapZ [Sphaerisporangium siamense]MBB4702295.1 UPF0042 nucleotide-binding protein [Sphaerisporangium siamense]